MKNTSTILLAIVLAGCGAGSVDSILLKSYEFDRRDKSLQRIQTLIPQSTGEDLLNLHLRAAELCGGDETKRHYRAALALDPSSTQALSGFASRDLFDGDSEIDEILQSWVKAEPENGLPLYFLAYRQVRRKLNEGKPSSDELAEALRLTRKANETGFIHFHPLFDKLKRQGTVVFSQKLLHQAEAERSAIPMPRGAFRHLGRQLCFNLIPKEKKHDAQRIMLAVVATGDNLALSEPRDSLMLLTGSALWDIAFRTYLKRPDLAPDDRARVTRSRVAREQAIEPFRQAVCDETPQSFQAEQLHMAFRKLEEIRNRRLSTTESNATSD